MPVYALLNSYIMVGLKTVDQALPTIAWERLIKDDYPMVFRTNKTGEAIRPFAMELECSLSTLFYKFQLVCFLLLSPLGRAWSPCTL
jgi:hypothetical protein